MVNDKQLNKDSSGQDKNCPFFYCLKIVPILSQTPSLNKKNTNKVSILFIYKLGAGIRTGSERDMRRSGSDDE